MANPYADRWESVECRQNDPEMWWVADELHVKMSNDDLERIRMAITICNRCPLRSECLEIGMQPDNIRWGIWGGTFAGERLAATGRKFGGNADKNLIEKARRLRARLSKTTGENR